ncbi:Endo-1,6-beta-D-glucanase [Trametes pubescens]|uniref:Endo-1,6-beta-D-glucanase n=1 Tax=Trametes pubescens TaxID=154538 RepID=A0A1M2VKL4_TRAPU|nr:Endo-1,6-beta-D-glucanase [Trametes pubescens]
MRLTIFASVMSCAIPVLSQQIYDVWSTTWDRSQLFTYKNLYPKPVQFKTPGAIGAADIVLSDAHTYQSLWGFGASLTDSSAQVLSNLKTKNADSYWQLLKYLFDNTDGANSAGFTYLRIPLGASDFSTTVYSFDDVCGDTSLKHFDINKAPSSVFSVLKDIRSINSAIKVHLLPWSPPGWMKDTGSMKGGNFLSKYSTAYANYLLKSLQAYKNKGVTVFAIGIQNEPENYNPTYPTCVFTAAQEAQVAKTLRTLMNNNGFSGTKIIGYDHNWNDAAGYPVDLMNDAASAFAGVGFHCYSGSVGQQDAFHSAYPKKDILFTECSGVYGSDWWSDLKWYMDNIFIGAIEHNSKTGLMWNIALDGNGQPMLPGTNSCSPPCRPVATVNSDGSWSVNQEFYAMAQASKAIIPRDAGGPFGRRIAVSLGGSQSWALRVSAFVTGRANSDDWLRYSLVVLNWADNINGAWNPTPVKTTIEFRGQQATYTFPVGITTLWWYAPNQGHYKREDLDDEAIVFGNSTEADVTLSAETSADGASEDLIFEGTLYSKSNGEKVRRTRFH